MLIVCHGEGGKVVIEDWIVRELGEKLKRIFYLFSKGVYTCKTFFFHLSRFFSNVFDQNFNRELNQGENKTKFKKTTIIRLLTAP